MIGLYNLEPQYINIALEKVRLYYELYKEKEVEDYIPLEHEKYEKIYCSSIFTWTNKTYLKDNMIYGGTGFTLKSELPKEIDIMRPYINIGFTTRGCIRNCPFCVVPIKEGKFRITDSDINSIWDGKSREITLLDNNILANKKHFINICDQIHNEGLIVDFTQGLDARLITREIAYVLTNIRHKKQIHIAWDFIEDENDIMKGINNLIIYTKPSNIMCYILVGYNTTEDEDLYRVNKLKEIGIDPFVMSYNKNPKYKRFARWVNHKAIFKTVEWKDYK